MADETTPLTTTGDTSNVGPPYVFPNGVSPRSRRHNMKMQQLQCCISITFIIILIVALCLTLAFSGIFGDRNYNVAEPGFFFVTNETAPSANITAIQTELAATKMPLADEPEAEWALRRKSVNNKDGAHAVNAGIKALGDREILEENTQPIPVNSPAYKHYRSLSTNPEARKLARRGYVENRATASIAERFNYTKQAGRNNIGKGPRITFGPDSASQMSQECNFNSRYRTANGVCNNKEFPRTYGAAMVPYRRMVAPDYADGISSPRTGNNGTGYLPPAREVSLKIHRSTYETDSNFTVLLAVFGQFLDHDITATSLTTSQDGDSIDCCAAALEQHPECFPVAILPTDPYYKKYNVTCMNFVRSAPAPTGHFGPRQQLNQATAFIDGSVVYGNFDQRQQHLRNFMNGTLRMFITADERQLLPISSNPEDGCNRMQMLRKGKYCFESGDDRANENLLLTSMHLLWARHHNFLAKGLRDTNPHWNDEMLFQEARKILSAQMAHITYNEFLPILLGRKLASKMGLLPSMGDLDAPDTYNSHVDPSIANCFAAAAFRFAHTLLPGLFKMTRSKTSQESIELHKMLFNPFSLWAKDGLENALTTAANTAVLHVNRFFSLEVTQKLFEGTAEDKPPICGLDLVSLNIQRGRDHGIPAYSVFRRHCHLPPVDTWEQMAGAMDNETLESIKQIYNMPDDVDLYTGALSETPLDGAIFGPLLTCMISDQFIRIKMGDSHWYERKIGPQRFTKAQLAEIYKTTLSGIICINTLSIERIQKYVMERRKDAPNLYVNCSELIPFNFTQWSEEQAQQTHQLHRAGFSQSMTLVRIFNQTQELTAAAPSKMVNSTTTENVTLTNGHNEKE